MKRKAYQLQARRGYSFENAVLAAFARFEEHFWDEPAVKAWREALEQEELNDWLEESMPTTDEIINGYPEDCDSPPFC